MRPLHLVFLFALAGCGGRSSADYAKAGAHLFGVHTFTFVDTTRPTMMNHEFAGLPSRTLPVEVWYPATDEGRDATLAPGGPYPLVLHSHGFLDNRTGESYLGEHLASHGYVVASIDYPLTRGGSPGGATIKDTPNQPDDARFVIDRLLAESANPSSPLGGAIDGSRIGASGLSLGGLTTLLITHHPRLRDPRVRAAYTMAAPACPFTEPFWRAAEVPLLLMHGDSDLIIPHVENAVRAFERSHDPRRMILLRRGSHTGFTGFASLFDPAIHYDRIGCSALEAVTIESLAGLGNPDEGVSADPSVCPMPCAGSVEDPSLDADRQHDLVRTTALAFFDSQFRDDAAAAQFLDAPVQSENPEVTLRLP